jgi:transposase-like protein
MTIIDRFGDEQRCWEFLVGLRWPNGIACGECGSMDIGLIAKRNRFYCKDCRKQFAATSGTAFADSHLPLRKWFLAVFLMCESKKGISALQLQTMLKVSYNTAWFLTHRIRHAMGSQEPELLDGIVEVDETYVGGKVHGKGRHYTGNKTMVVGAKERDGSVNMRIAKTADRKTLHGFIHAVVSDDAEAIYTDDWKAYGGIADENTRHETVNHSAKEYVRGDVHTNGIESVWSLLDRSIIGAFHQVSAKHLDAYVDELEFRFNNRDNPYLFRDTIIRLLQAQTLRYRELVADAEQENRASAL